MHAATLGPHVACMAFNQPEFAWAGRLNERTAITHPKNCGLCAMGSALAAKPCLPRAMLYQHVDCGLEIHRESNVSRPSDGHNTVRNPSVNRAHTCGPKLSVERVRPCCKHVYSEKPTEDTYSLNHGKHLWHLPHMQQLHSQDCHAECSPTNQ